MPVQKNMLLDKEVAEVELKDSAKLMHIHGLFYKSATGQLFERTLANREVAGEDTLSFVEYFNGVLPQEIDPFTFEELDGWFAKDRNHVYYYRPTSGGMLCIKIDSADVKSFKVLENQYLYGADSKHVFKENTLIENIDPNKMQTTLDTEGHIVKIKCGNVVYTAD